MEGERDWSDHAGSGLHSVAEALGNNVHGRSPLELQEVERLLEGVAGRGGRGSDPTTGFTALASSPTFNQNSFSSGIARPTGKALSRTRHRPME